MNRGQRRVIAEMIASTVRVLELLGLDYEVTAPKNQRKKGNKSPRVVYAKMKDEEIVRIYNDWNGHIWANRGDGKPIKGVRTTEELHNYLYERLKSSR
ncbi:MAG: hypothetical protein IT430_10085 [Phycisphaerales bacterium]|nr:hypothetical protein [Phycisphaerales bacterium]